MPNEQLSVFNPNTRVKEIRTDFLPDFVDLNVVFDPASDGRAERGESWDKLGALVKTQIATWPGDETTKDRLWAEIENRHPGDYVAGKILMEPVLFLSNLTIHQLKQVRNLLYLSENPADRYDKAPRAEAMVTGYILGRESELATKSIIINQGE